MAYLPLGYDATLRGEPVPEGTSHGPLPAQVQQPVEAVKNADGSVTIPGGGTWKTSGEKPASKVEAETTESKEPNALEKAVGRIQKALGKVLRDPGLVQRGEAKLRSVT
ncbi:hypothetical protein EXIGLDRAFT_766704 [Exidia glandulosa HHB12029]|uniref:Uncharacterized protein n=1 Tax=Exidia glandulosa HHB12029 TaxID=1314781 RepID=A0A165JGR3_EXIGL|nr:hypothetical protein EXIGLDRAFT_766704 [Exidia glandulosa HHB12029]